jgi:hypothetical protein
MIRLFRVLLAAAWFLLSQGRLTQRKEGSARSVNCLLLMVLLPVLCSARGRKDASARNVNRRVS